MSTNSNIVSNQSTGNYEEAYNNLIDYKSIKNKNKDNSNDISNLIDFFFKKERRMLKDIGFISKSRQYSNSKDMTQVQIEEQVEEISEYIHKRISPEGNNRNKWGNLYEYLGRRDTYANLANLSSTVFHRQTLLYMMGQDSVEEKKRTKEIQKCFKKAEQTIQTYINAYRGIVDQAKNTGDNIEYLFSKQDTKAMKENPDIKIRIPLAGATIRSNVITAFVNEIKNKDFQQPEELKDALININNQIIEQFKDADPNDLKNMEEKIAKKIQDNLNKNEIIIYGYFIKDNKFKNDELVKFNLSEILKKDSTTKDSTTVKSGFEEIKKSFALVDKEDKGKLTNMRSKTNIKNFYNDFVNMLISQKQSDDVLPSIDKIISFLRTVNSSKTRTFQKEEIERFKKKYELNISNTKVKEMLKRQKEISLYIQYTNQGVSGILGEIRGAIASTYGFRIGETKIVGSDTAASGQLAQDVQIQKKNNERLGLQVKNYVFSNKNITLYDTELSLSQEKFLNRYIYKTYNDNLRKFLVSYTQEDSNKQYGVDVSNSLMQQLIVNIHNFLRISQQDFQGAYNIFFLVNDLYYPVSYVLRLFQLQYLKRSKDVNDMKKAFQINNKRNQLIFNSDKKHIKNILKSNKIKFKGVTIPISRFTK